MQGSKIGYQTWATAMYLFLSSLKGVSSMKLHRDLGVTQKTARHLAMRIRRAFEQSHGKFLGPVEVDETYVGGKRRGRARPRRGREEHRGRRLGPRDGHDQRGRGRRTRSG